MTTEDWGDPAVEDAGSWGDPIAEPVATNPPAIQQPARKGGLGGLLSNAEPIFETAAKRHGLDALMLKSIAALETDNGKSRALRAHNNPGGLMRPDNPHQFQSFATLDEGVDAMASLLSRNYVKKGLTTIEAIGAKYSPPGASNDPNHTNATWPSGVRSWMKRLGSPDEPGNWGDPMADAPAESGEPPAEGGNVGSEFMGTLAKTTAETVGGAMRGFEGSRKEAQRPRVNDFEIAQQMTAGNFGQRWETRKAPETPPLVEEATQFAGDVAGASREAWGAPEEPPADIPSQIARGAANVTAMLPTLTLGIPVSVAQGGALAYEQGFQNAVANGADEEEAHTAASQSAVHTVPALATYLVGGKLAASAVAKLLPNASPIVKGLAGTLAGTAANVTSSTAIRAVEGQPLAPTAEGLTQDALFGAIHGLGEKQKAESGKRKAESPAPPPAPARVRWPEVIPPDFAEGLTTGIDPQALAGYDAFANVLQRRRADLPQPPPVSSAEPPLVPAASAGSVVENRPAPAPAPRADEMARSEQPAVDQGAGDQDPGASGNAAPARKEWKPGRKFAVAFSDPFFEEPTVAFIVEQGGLMSKARAIEKYGTAHVRDRGEYNDAPAMAVPLHNAIYSKGGLPPDDMVKALVEKMGWRTDAVVSDLWSFLDGATKAALRERKFRASQREQMKELTKQGKAFNKEVAAPKKPTAPAIPVDELAIGDVVKAGEEMLKVTAIDPDTLDVTLEDGKRYGVQEVKAGEVIYGEHEPVAESPDAWGDLAIESGEQKAESGNAEGLVRGDRFTDSRGQMFEVWKNRQGTIEAHPVIDGKPVVNRETTQRWAVSSDAKARNPQDRTDIFVEQPLESGKPKDFTLATQTEAEVQAARDAAAAKAKLEQGLAKPLTGSAGDLTSDMFGATEGETPLFNARRDQVLGMPLPSRENPRNLRAMPEDQRAAPSDSGQPSPSGQKAREFRNDPEEYARALIKDIPKGAPGISRETVDGQPALVARNAKGKAEGVIKHTGTELTDIAVAKQARGTGVASRLLDELKLLGIESARGPFTPTSKAILEKRGFNLNPESRAPSGGALTSAEQRALGAPGLSGRHALTMAMEGEGNVSIPQVMDSFAAIVHTLGAKTPIRIGRFLQRAMGIWKPREDVARIGNAGNLRTGAHEIAHAMQQHVFGDFNSGVLHARLPADVVTELVNQGRAIYPKPPANGWASEGWAETWANYLTSDDLPTVAPKTAAWLEKTFLPSQSAEFQQAVRTAKANGDLWRSQGAMNRSLAQNPKPPGAVARFRERTSGYIGTNRWIEEFKPLNELAAEYSKLTGKKLSPSTNPYEVASAKRGSSGATVLQMALHGMVDLNGNLKRDVSGRLVGSMAEIVKPARGLEDEFGIYLWARRAVELHGSNRDPGMPLKDALHLVPKLEAAHPDFAPTAQRLYDWQNAVLDYLVEANPAMAPNVAAMRAASSNYVPLSRVMESGSARKTAGVLAASPLARLKGSGRQVKPIFDQILANTQRIVASAHKAQVLKTIIEMSRTPGMGYLIEEVPRDRVRNTVPIEKIRKQMEDLGVDTSAIPDGEMLNFYTLAEQPKGSDPIVPIKVNGETKWYQVDPELYDVLSGLEPARLPPLLDLMLGAPARGFRMGTTGLRASFALVTNPTRDLQTLLAQTMASDNPARVLSAYVGALVDVVRGGPGKQLFQQLAIEGGQPLGMDVPHTRKAVRGLFNGPVREAVTHPVEMYRSMLNFMESVPRIAEMKMTAENLGYVWGTPMTPDQAIAIANAGKRVTTDFSAGGDLAKMMNQAIPFFNASIQGARTFGRTFKERPVAAAVKGLAYFVAPALALWALNRDKKWYQDLPWRERYQYWNFSPDGRNVMQISRPMEWGALASLAEGAADSWARRDPRGIEEALLSAKATVTPLDYPVLLKAAKEQWQNRIDFFDKPIVPRGEVDLPPGDQFAPYTSTIAKSLGKAFPETLSPRRIDAAVRSIFGGVGGDLLSRSDDLIRALGLNPAQEQEAREWEQSDIPVLGRIFRRGGVSSGSNQTLADFWDTYLELEARSKSQVHPLDGGEQFYRQALKSAHDIIKVQEKVANATANLSARQALYQSMGEVARTALDSRPLRK